MEEEHKGEEGVEEGEGVGKEEVKATEIKSQVEVVRQFTCNCLLANVPQDDNSSHTSTESKCALKWNAVETATDVPPAVFPFTAQPGLKIPFSADARPFEFFQLFFGDDTMELLVEETGQ